MGNRTAKTLKANGIRDLDGMKMREDYRLARVPDDQDCICGICLGNVGFYQNACVDIDAQVSPLS